MSLSASMPTTAIVFAANESSARLSARPPTACGLCATSRTTIGRPWRGSGSARQVEFDEATPHRLHRHRQPRSENDSTTASAALALRSWPAPRSAGLARPARRSPPRPQKVHCRVAEVPEIAARAGAGPQPSPGHARAAMRRLGIGADRRAAGAKDARLLEADRLAVTAQPVGMIERDAGHHGTIGRVGIDRIQPATQPDFENQHLDLFGDEDFHRRQGAELEVGQRTSPDSQSRRLDSGKGSTDARVVRPAGDRRVPARCRRAGAAKCSSRPGSRRDE
jgi:hypothetical protein